MGGKSYPSSQFMSALVSLIWIASVTFRQSLLGSIVFSEHSLEPFCHALYQKYSVYLFLSVCMGGLHVSWILSAHPVVLFALRSWFSCPSFVLHGEPGLGIHIFSNQFLSSPFSLFFLSLSVMWVSTRWKSVLITLSLWATLWCESHCR